MSLSEGYYWARNPLYFVPGCRPPGLPDGSEGFQTLDLALEAARCELEGHTHCYTAHPEVELRADCEVIQETRTWRPVLRSLADKPS